jgi:hypothetical protein
VVADFFNFSLEKPLKSLDKSYSLWYNTFTRDAEGHLRELGTAERRLFMGF